MKIEIKVLNRNVAKVGMSVGWFKDGGYMIQTQLNFSATKSTEVDKENMYI